MAAQDNYYSAVILAWRMLQQLGSGVDFTLAFTSFAESYDMESRCGEREGLGLPASVALGCTS
eukprot:7472622-Karenia_brevis.AAC.1